MSDFYSLPPYQYENAADSSGEYYRDVPPPTTNALPDISQKHFPTFKTEPLTSISQQHTGKFTTPTTAPLVLSDITTTQSLVASLQATMKPKTTKPVVIIPGAKKRSKAAQVVVPSTRRIHPPLRHGIIVGTIFLVLLTALLSLAPLDNGQSSYHLLNGVVEWVQSEQQTWNIASHLAATQNDSGNASTTSAHPPPMTLPTSQYVAIARQDAIDAGIPPDYFVRQIYLESGFNPNAQSGAGAAGIAQFMPGTARGLGIDPWDPIAALKAAAQMMANSARQYGGDYAKALAAYNAGSGTVNHAINVCGSSWMNCLPAETRHYIYIIMGV